MPAVNPRPPSLLRRAAPALRHRALVSVAVAPRITAVRTVAVLAVAVLAVAVLAAAPAQAKGDGDYHVVSGAHFKPLPLAVAPFGGSAAPAKALREALNEDLAISGIFELLDPASFLADPKKEGLSASTIDFSKWNAVGADSLLKANVSGDARNGKVDFRLFAVVSGKQTLQAEYEFRDGDLRTVAHAFADRLYEHFTGERGVFRTRLAWVRRVGGSKDLWVSDFDGRNAFALTASGGLNILPAWSPDGRTIAFTSFRSGSPMLHLLDVATKSVRALPARGDLQTGAAFSPDGKLIAFTLSDNGNSDVYVMNVDGTGLKRLTDSRESDSSPSWSPDGKRIAFVSTRSGGPQIFVMNADGTGVERLTFQGNYNQTPDWSPRGDLIAFTARDERRRFDVFTVDPKTKKIRRLTQDQGDNEEPSFSPNGRHIVFASTRDGGKKRVWIMNADGTNQRRLPIDGEHGTPAWGPWTD